MTGSKSKSPPATILGSQRITRIGAGGLLWLLLSASASAQIPVASVPPSIDLQYQALSGPLNKPHVEGVKLLYGGELSLNSDVADGDRLLNQYVLSGNVTAHEADTTIKASKITLAGLTKRALAENALLTQRVFTLRAKSIVGTADFLTASDAVITTVPPGESADANLRVQSVILDSVHHRGTLKNVSLYVFRTRLLTLPRLTFHLGEKGGTARHQSMIPVIGVSSRYGTYLTFGNSLGPEASLIRYRLLLPTRQSVEGSVSGEQRLYSPRRRSRRAADTAPAPETLLDRIRASATAPAGPLPEGDPLLFHDFLPEANPIRLFDGASQGGVTLAEVVSVHLAAQGRKRDDLYVTRLPELTLTGQFLLTPVPDAPASGDPKAFRDTLRHLVVYADAQETYGNYREQLSSAPYAIRERRVRTQFALSARPLLVASNTVLLPRISVSTSSYSGSKTAYRYDQASVALNHYFSDLSAVGVQYLASTTSGDSPFNFDVLDTTRELDVRLQLGNRHLVAAGRVRYDLSRSGVIDYQVALSPTLRGFSPVFSYNFRTRSLGLGIEVKGITF